MKALLYPMLKRIPIKVTEELLMYKDPKKAVESSKVTYRTWNKGWVLHHTWRPRLKDGLKYHAASIDKYHRITRGWKNGLGYHFLIEWDGSIVIGKRWKQQLCGAHTRGVNCQTIGIALVGDFDVEVPLVNQLASLTQLVYWLNQTIWKVQKVEELFQLTHYHHDFASYKTCPGKKWWILKEILTAESLNGTYSLLKQRFYKKK